MRAKALPAISASTMGSEDGWEEVQTGRKSIRSRPDAREKSDRKNEKSKQMTNTEREPRSGRGRGREASKVTEKRSPRDNSESKTEEKLASKHTASQKPLVKQPTVVVAAALAPAVPEISAELQHIAESFEAITLQDGSTGDSLPAPPPKPKAWSLGNRPSIHAEPSLTLPDSDSLEHTVVLKQLYTSNVDFQSVCQTYFNSTESIISKHPAVIR